MTKQQQNDTPKTLKSLNDYNAKIKDIISINGEWFEIVNAETNELKPVAEPMSLETMFGEDCLEVNGTIFTVKAMTLKDMKDESFKDLTLSNPRYLIKSANQKKIKVTSAATDEEKKNAKLHNDVIDHIEQNEALIKRYIEKYLFLKGDSEHILYDDIINKYEWSFEDVDKFVKRLMRASD